MKRSRRVDSLICESMSFLVEVKQVFQDKKEKYEEFLKLILDFEAGIIDLEVTREGVMELFKEHNDLISRFNIFLPPGHEIPLPTDDDQQNEDESAIKDDEQQSDEGLALKDDEE
ncbi:paired amphipathic helix protein SIN3 4-like [Trifolium pratense]|uniref:Paired amphipathic helix protein SIN3 4-like n=2 Tax=Trifolium pratense TaxID=57577 RepID=A0A2K3KZ90_TRIPR|nr:paired amphipathic helix protein SIN3 4-like [Trifolium pratense]CAJ2630296.1 unnamed protein product [Trifolium pratense]